MVNPGISIMVFGINHHLAVLFPKTILFPLPNSATHPIGFAFPSGSHFQDGGSQVESQEKKPKPSQGLYILSFTFVSWGGGAHSLPLV